jgi:hypothetical protein
MSPVTVTKTKSGDLLEQNIDAALAQQDPKSYSEMLYNLDNEDDLRPRLFLTYPEYPTTYVYLYVDNNGESWLEYQISYIDSIGKEGIQDEMTYVFDSKNKSYLENAFPNELAVSQIRIFNVTDQYEFVARNLHLIGNASQLITSYLWHRTLLLIAIVANLVG